MKLHLSLFFLFDCFGSIVYGRGSCWAEKHRAERNVVKHIFMLPVSLSNKAVDSGKCCFTEKEERKEWAKTLVMASCINYVTYVCVCFDSVIYGLGRSFTEKKRRMSCIGGDAQPILICLSGDVSWRRENLWWGSDEAQSGGVGVSHTPSLTFQVLRHLPSNCQNWCKRHWRGTLCLCAAVHWHSQCPPEHLGTSKTASMRINMWWIHPVEKKQFHLDSNDISILFVIASCI